LDVVHRLRAALKVNVFDPDVWKGAWYMLNYTVKYNADMIKRHFTGDYDTDEWGLDWELLDAVRPFFSFMYKAYWRVETSGIDNIPIEGRALMAANYSGQLPWDGTMVSTAVLSEHPAQRLVRTLYADWYARLPFLSSWLSRMGQALATEDNGLRLLEQDALVAVYPEGYQGATKLYRDRYKLARFGDGGFVQIALRSQAPIIPVSVVGGEETYIVLGSSRVLTQATGLPAFPITPTFPWLGLLGLVPLPTKWFIDFGEPISMNGYDPRDADNLVLVAQVNDQVRNLVQEMIYNRLAKRKSVFLG
jgi:1-acyl-sn-glycerol-3-phosphate acyltransferase